MPEPMNETGREAARLLARGARSRAELREWLQMTGLIPDDEREEKYCSRCDTVKAAGDFCSDPSTPTGLYSWCRDCSARYKRTTESDEHRRKRNRAQYARSRQGKPDRRRRENRELSRAAGEPVRVTVKLPPELGELLALDAAASGKNLSELVREAIAARYESTSAEEREECTRTRSGLSRSAPA